MGYRIRSESYLKAQKSLLSHQSPVPTQLQIVRHLANRYQAMAFLGYATYVYVSKNLREAPSIRVGGKADRGGQVRGDKNWFHGCHNAYGHAWINGKSMGNLWKSASNGYFVRRVLSWTDLLNQGVNGADTLSERGETGLLRAGTEFLEVIAKETAGNGYDKIKGNRIVKDAIQSVLFPLSARAYTDAAAKFESGDKHTALAELVSSPLSRQEIDDIAKFNVGGAPSSADERVADTYIGDWRIHNLTGILVPPSDLIKEQALDYYQQFSRNPDGQSGELSANPPVLAKHQGEAVLEYLSSNEEKAPVGANTE